MNIRIFIQLQICSKLILAESGPSFTATDLDFLKNVHLTAHSMETSSLPFVLNMKRGGSDEAMDTAVINEKEEGAEEISTKGEAEVDGSEIELVLKAAGLEVVLPPPPSGADSDPDGIPTRFLRMHKDKRRAALESYKGTLKWRKENDVDNTLNKPHPNFDVCKMLIPHYIPGFDAAGNVILVQRPGLFNVELKNKNNVTDDDLVNHMVYVLECCWSLVSPPKVNEDGFLEDCVMTSIIDMTGINLGIIRQRSKIDFASKFVSLMSSHYPSRSFKTLIINAPKWFHTLFNFFKPILRESTRKKIEILSSGRTQDRVLRELLGDSTPDELLSSTPTVLSDEHAVGKAGPHSNIEIELQEFCRNRLQAFNLTMNSLKT